MKKSSLRLSILLVLIITAFWFAGSWWHYACNIKNTCDANTLLTQDITPEMASPPVASHPEPIRIIDTDNDGLSDEEEEKIGTEIHLVDTDSDSIPDNEEVGTNLFNPLDTDNDGIIDALDVDDDNDGLSTLTEEKIGTSSLLADTDADGVSDNDEVGQNSDKPLDTDGDGIINALDTDDDDDSLETAAELLLGINPLLADSDGDGLSDSDEIGDFIDQPLDTDADGIIDALDTTDDLDNDGDGLINIIEAQLNTDPEKQDTDGDGIDDAIEVGDNPDQPLDVDLDGIIDALDTVNDTDSDNDGLSDDSEKILGSNPKEVDSDHDGINDNEEIGNNINDPLDSDEDGIHNLIDSDDDNDGLMTKTEIKIGTNPLSKDSDGDGLSDYEELGQNTETLLDTDNDGKINPVDNDDDGDGLLTLIELSLGSDPLSEDTDMDGITDSIEVGSDSKNPIDIDKDGIPDIIDTFNDLHYEESQTLDAQVKKLLLADAAAEKSAAQAIIASAKKAAETVENRSNENTEITLAQESTPITANADKVMVEPIEGRESKAFQPSRLYFPSKSPTPILTTDATNYFNDVVTWMMKSKDNAILLKGHTDSIGTTQKNLALGIRRVMVIREILIDLGAPIQQIDIMSRGESTPLFDNETNIGRLKNRRVEIAPIQ